MSKLPGNPYVEEMKNAVDERPETWLTHGDIATLALAYEQRTTSLIALVESEAFNFSLSTSQADAIAQQVMVRLGVGRPMDEGADLDDIADTGTYTPPTEPPVHPPQVPVQTDRKYTPTETYIRACLMAQLDWERENDGKSWTPERGQEIVAEADRLIARVKAEVWDEGLKAGLREANDKAAGRQNNPALNPYRVEKGAGEPCGCDLSGMAPPAIHIVDGHEDDDE